MKLSYHIDENLKIFNSMLPLGKSFDLIERVIAINNRKFYLFFIDGFTKDVNLEYVRRDIASIPLDVLNHIHTAQELIERAISAIEASTETDIQKMITALLSGQTLILFDGSASAAVLDLRTYPTRGINEPDKEKVLRGAKDGFVETIVFNTALIRRRIRDPHLVFEMQNIGTISQTDVAIGYLSNKVNKKALRIIKEKLDTLQVDALTVSDQSLVEALQGKSWRNPLPKVRYTERPDVAAAQIMEGKIIIIVDNTPSVMILPTGFLDFTQDVDDYYMPVLTGNYLRFVRNIIIFINLLLTPFYVLLVDNPSWVPSALDFILPEVAINVPLFIQFLMLEIAVDGLKIASLNTPSSLGTSLSVIGGLILGEYAVSTGWLIPHAILYMALVALSSFTQPSIEMSYAIKFFRIILLLLTGLLGIWGFVGGILLNLIVLANTKTLAGESYLYPIYPFNWPALKTLLFRTPINTKQKVSSK